MSIKGFLHLRGTLVCNTLHTFAFQEKMYINKQHWRAPSGGLVHYINVLYVQFVCCVITSIARITDSKSKEHTNIHRVKKKWGWGGGGEEP